jgi:hypothetical protein
VRASCGTGAARTALSQRLLANDSCLACPDDTARCDVDKILGRGAQSAAAEPLGLPNLDKPAIKLALGLYEVHASAGECRDDLPAQGRTTFFFCHPLRNVHTVNDLINLFVTDRLAVNLQGSGNFSYSVKC